MDLEDRFSVSIEPCGRIDTVADLAELMAAKMAIAGRPLPRDEVLLTVRTILAERCAVPLGGIRSDTKLTNLE